MSQQLSQPTGANRKEWYRMALFALVAGLLTTGCMHQQQVRPGSDQELVPADQQRVADLEASNRQLNQEVAAQRDRAEQLRRQVAAVQIRLLAKEAELQRATQFAEGVQRQLNETVLELARTKGKLRSLNSRAEAAASLAEAEVALKSALQLGDGEDGRRLKRASELVRMSSAEFADGNFSGSVYLTQEARLLLDAVKAAAVTNSARAEDNGGENRFASPIPFEVIERSNVRSAPSLKADILYLLEPGTRVVGVGYFETWVHVEAEGQPAGWIFYELVLPR